jgi:hypothetical protein
LIYQTEKYLSFIMTAEPTTTADDAEFVDVSFAKDGGVCKKILQAAPEDARGPPPKGNEVEAHYTGRCG